MGLRGQLRTLVDLPGLVRELVWLRFVIIMVLWEKSTVFVIWQAQ